MQLISCGSYISRNSAQCPMTNELVSDKHVRIGEMGGRSFGCKSASLSPIENGGNSMAFCQTEKLGASAETHQYQREARRPAVRQGAQRPHRSRFPTSRSASQSAVRWCEPAACNAPDWVLAFGLVGLTSTAIAVADGISSWSNSSRLETT